jgi:hypothetical protein
MHSWWQKNFKNQSTKQNIANSLSQRDSIATGLQPFWVFIDPSELT